MITISFVAAASNSGKTTLIEKVVRILKGKGLRVGVIKHASKGYALSPELEELYRRYSSSGADMVIFSGPEQLVMMRNTPLEPYLQELQTNLGEVDIVLYEGFKANAINKIEVFRHGVSGVRSLCADDPSFIALATNKKYDVTIPQLDMSDAQGIADYISGGENEE